MTETETERARVHLPVARNRGLTVLPVICRHDNCSENAQSVLAENTKFNRLKSNCKLQEKPTIVP